MSIEYQYVYTYMYIISNILIKPLCRNYILQNFTLYIEKKKEREREEEIDKVNERRELTNSN